MHLPAYRRERRLLDPLQTVANDSFMDGISTSCPMGRVSWPRATRVQLTLVFGRIEMA
jgi:hypothetical protein